jgi:sugar-specific transcriptional regulator TrmB
MARSSEGSRTTVSPERIDKLTAFGLTDYEARVYLALLDLGTAAAAEIPVVSRVPRTRVYATMQQLHAKGLVQILPEKPLRYRAAPLSAYLTKLAEDYRRKATQLASNTVALSREFAAIPHADGDTRGRFEAIYGRRNVRDRLLEMVQGAESSLIAIGSMHSPARIVHGLGVDLEEKAAAGVNIKMAFFLNAGNAAEAKALSGYAAVRHIDFFTPVCRHGVDGKEFLMSHPIPDDDSPFRGEDIAIWTDDRAIAYAMAQMTERIWEMGKPAGGRVRRVAAERPRRRITPMAES